MGISEFRKTCLLPEGKKRAKGIEPSWLAWEASALPLCYARKSSITDTIHPEPPVFQPFSENNPLVVSPFEPRLNSPGKSSDIPANREIF